MKSSIQFLVRVDKHPLGPSVFTRGLGAVFLSANVRAETLAELLRDTKTKLLQRAINICAGELAWAAATKFLT